MSDPSADDRADAPAPEDPDTGPTARPAARGVALGRRGLGWLRRNAYLALAAAAVLTVTEVVDFSPPDEVRVGKGDVAQLVGDAPPQEFSHELSNPQTVQLRATLRLYPNNELPVASPDPSTDMQGRLLSQPVVTTLLGMNATVDQTIRLEGGELEVDLVLHGTPRLGVRPRGSEAPHPLTLEHELTVSSRRHTWWRGTPRARVHVDSRGMLTKVDRDGYRLVFTVDEHLFSLDLELHRAGMPLPDSTFAGGRGSR
ncbi:MAG: hypothetical protein AB1Z98_18650 [Nannocystaceae bacterium]